MSDLTELTTISILSNYLVEETIDPSEQNANENRSVAKINEVVTKINDGSVVETGNTQTISGVKTFSNGIKTNQIDPLTTNAKITVEIGTGGLYANDDSSDNNKYLKKTEIVDLINGTSGAVVMTGATSIADGTSGLAPKPIAGDQDKVLTGAATYVDISARSETLTNKIIDGDNNTLQDIGGASIKSTSKSGNTNVLATVSGSVAQTNLASYDVSGNLIDSTISTITAKPIAGILASNKTVTGTSFSAVSEFALTTTTGRTYNWEINGAFDIETTCGIKIVVIPPGGSNNPYLNILTVVEGSSGAAVLNGGRDPSGNALVHVPGGAGTFGFRSTGTFTSASGGNFSFQFANSTTGGANSVVLRAGATCVLRCVG